MYKTVSTYISGVRLSSRDIGWFLPDKDRTDHRSGILKELEQSLREVCLPKPSLEWS